MDLNPFRAPWRQFAPARLNDIPVMSRSSSLGSEPCTVVIGPPGGGKTTLLAQWYDELCSRGERPVWCSAIAGDGDGPRRGTVHPGGPSGGWTLFLDDADQVEPDKIETLLEDMAAAGGRGGLPSWLVLATRTTPDRVLEWSRHGTVRTVRTDEVVLPEDLVPAILLDYRSDLEPSELAMLVEKIGNWPAGAHLAGQAIGHPAELPAAAQQFDGRDLGVCDYLDTEVFGGLDTADQDFLVTCSVLEELTPTACAMLTGDQLAEERLQRLSRQHALIRSSERTGTWNWRPLAESYLQTKLALRSAKDVAELRRRVRGWAMARRSYPEAAAQAGATEDWNVIVRLILDVGLEKIAAGENTMVLDWIDSLPATVRQRETGLATVAAVAPWVSAGIEGQATIDDWLDHAAIAPYGRPPAKAPSAAVGVDLIRSLLGTLTPEQRLALATKTEFEPENDDPSWSALQLLAIGFARYLSDDSQQAKKVLAECLQQHGPAGERSSWFLDIFGSSVIGLLALTEQEENEYDRAAVLLSTVALSSTGEHQPEPFTGLIDLAGAREAWHDGNHDVALRLLRAVGGSSQLLWVRALAMLDMAELYRQNDDGAKATALATADRLLAQMKPPPPVLIRLRNSLDRHELEGMNPLDDSGLTERELEVLRLLSTDLTRRQIAGQLFLAHNTVKTYIQRLYHKLDVSSRPAAIARARERGWLD